MPDILQLIINQTSSDNNARRNAELEFNQVVSQNPSESAYLILEYSLNSELPVDVRQSCLLQLKRIVPKFWSMGFGSFVGPPVAQDLKLVIRSRLLDLAVGDTNSKIRNGAAYAIVQIASADYPDEWPDLIAKLYVATTDYSNETAMLGGLLVLTDLFDDLITEEQFWEDGIGAQVINHLNAILENNKVTLAVKTQAMKLYESVLAILKSPEAFKDSKRKNFVIDQVTITLKIFIQLILLEGGNLVEIEFKSNVYKSMTTIIGTFHLRLPFEIKSNVLSFTIKDVSRIAPLYNQVALNEYKAPLYLDLDAVSVFNNLIDGIFQTISCVQHDVSISLVANIPEFLKNALVCTALPKAVVEEYQDDLNSYVAEITGLSVNVNPRDLILDFWGELNSGDVQEACTALVELFQKDDGRLLEAQLFTLEGILSNDHELTRVPLQTIVSFISYQTPALVAARCFLLLPKYFEKFGSNDIADNGDDGICNQARKVFSDMVVFAEKCNNSIIQIAALVSVTYYQHVFELDALDDSVQLIIFRLALLLIDECEEDGLPVLLEAIAAAITISPSVAASIEVTANVNVVELIFKIAYKDPANVQLISDSSDCLSALLENVNEQDYMVTCEKSLPFILKLMETSDGAYTPQLYLSLELLGIIIKSGPHKTLPSQIFEYAFHALKAILLKSTDDQILQSGGEVFNELIQRAAQLFSEYNDPENKVSGVESMLRIVYKFLSPELSDSAANKCGSIVCSLIANFQTQIPQEMLTRILQATVQRLVIAKEPITIENLVMVLCQLVLLSPEEMINFLSSMVINGEPGLKTVLPIWFDSYEITRGFEQIKQNTLALARIFTLGDSRVENLIVNGEIVPYDGDLIITRSMAKKMPERYTQISASLKILKLLAGELQFQCQQPDVADYLPNRRDRGNDEQNYDNDGDDDNDNNVHEGSARGGVNTDHSDYKGDDHDDDDDGWEDMDDIGVPNYEKLKSYIDDGNRANKLRGDDESLKELLVQFFKECAGENLGGFGKYYEQLSDGEKKIITECIVF